MFIHIDNRRNSSILILLSPISMFIIITLRFIILYRYIIISIVIIAYNSKIELQITNKNDIIIINDV